MIGGRQTCDSRNAYVILLALHSKVWHIKSGVAALPLYSCGGMSVAYRSSETLVAGQPTIHQHWISLVIISRDHACKPLFQVPVLLGPDAYAGSRCGRQYQGVRTLKTRTYFESPPAVEMKGLSGSSTMLAPRPTVLQRWRLCAKDLIESA